MDELMGCIKLFAGNFAPKGYMLCNGQLLSIAQNTALFSILGTSYGGDGVQTFALPNLMGRVAVGTDTQGQYPLGSIAGSPTTTLNSQQLPAHVHSGSGTISVSPANSTDSVPVKGMSIAVPGSSVARVFTGTLGFATSTPTIDLTSNITTGPAGSNLPVPIMQPYLAMNYIICVAGIFPSRN
jgi:microcystin-dependent protein